MAAGFAAIAVGEGKAQLHGVDAGIIAANEFAHLNHGIAGDGDSGCFARFQVGSQYHNCICLADAFAGYNLLGSAVIANDANRGHVFVQAVQLAVVLNGFTLVVCHAFALHIGCSVGVFNGLLAHLDKGNNRTDRNKKKGQDNYGNNHKAPSTLLLGVAAMLFLLAGKVFGNRSA